jgi:hypothetical protein
MHKTIKVISVRKKSCFSMNTGLSAGLARVNQLYCDKDHLISILKLRKRDYFYRAQTEIIYEK